MKRLLLLMALVLISTGSAMAQKKSKSDRAAQKAEQAAADAQKYRAMFASQNFLFVPSAWETENSSRMRINEYKFARVRKNGLQFDVPYFIGERENYQRFQAGLDEGEGKGSPVSFEEQKNEPHTEGSGQTGGARKAIGEVEITDLMADLMTGGFKVVKNGEIENGCILDLSYNDAGINYEVSIAMNVNNGKAVMRISSNRERDRFYIGTIREN